jgi:hypothetical protein
MLCNRCSSKQAMFITRVQGQVTFNFALSDNNLINVANQDPARSMCRECLILIPDT